MHKHTARWATKMRSWAGGTPTPLCAALAVSVAAPQAQQHAVMALLQLILRAGAIRPARLGSPWPGGATWAWAVSLWCIGVQHCIRVILRSMWDPSTAHATDTWLLPACVRHRPLLLHASVLSLEWVQVSVGALMPVQLLLLYSIGFTLLAAYGVWARAHQCTQPYPHVAVESLVWTVAVPWACREVLCRLIRWHQQHTMVCATPETALAPAAGSSNGLIQPGTVKGAQHQLGHDSCNGHAACGGAVTAPAIVLYQTPLGQHLQMTAKISTDAEVDDLPLDFHQQLQIELSTIGYHVLQVAARHGCIALRLDLLGVEGLGAAVGSSSGDLHSVAQRLLPLLNSMLPDLQAITSASEPTVRMQLGSAFLDACWDTSAAAWQLQPCSSPPALGKGTHLALGLMQQVPSDGLNLMHPATTAPADSSCRTASEHGPADSTAAYPIDDPPTSCGQGAAVCGREGDAASRGAVVMSLCAQLVTADGASAATASQLASLGGWQPASSPARHEEVDPASLRLMACCGDTYVHTHVLEVTQPAHAEGGGLTTASVKVEVCVPQQLLPRHHAGGPPAGLLPVVLELWQGEALLSSATTLLQVPGSQFWWWGAAGTTTARAMQQLQQLGAEVWPMQLLPSEVAAWHAFSRDLAIWLQHVRAVALLSRQCTAPAADASGVPHLILSLSKLQALGRCLLQFAAARKLHALVQLVQQQLVVVQNGSNAFAHGTPRATVSDDAVSNSSKGSVCVSGSSGTPSLRGGVAAVAARSMRDALLGARCEPCEARSRQEVARLLAGMQVVPSCVMAGLGLVVALRSGWLRQYSMLLPALLWALPHVLLAWRQLSRKAPSHRAGQARDAAAASRELDHTTRVCMQLCMSTYVVRQAISLGLAAGWLRLSSVMVAQLRSRMYLLDTLLMSIGEQATALLLLSPAGALAVTLAEAVLQLLMVHQTAGLTWDWAVGLPLASVLPRLLLEARLRATAGRGPSAPHSHTAQHWRCASM